VTAPSVPITPTAVIAAWQAALAAEQQAQFGYGLAGPRLVGSARGLAATYQARHGAIVVSTAETIRSGGANPVAPLVDYPALYPVATEAAARALVIRLEQDCASAWRYLYATASTPDLGTGKVNDPGAPSGTASGPGAARQSAQQYLIASATRATRWRLVSGTSPATVAFPGI
jgi:hypothetical protein